MSHSHFSRATHIDFQFVSPWPTDHQLYCQESLGFAPFGGAAAAAAAEGAGLRALPPYKWCFDKKSLLSQYFFIKLCTNLMDGDKYLAEYVAEEMCVPKSVCVHVLTRWSINVIKNSYA